MKRMINVEIGENWDAVRSLTQCSTTHVIQNRPTMNCVVVKVGQCHSYDGDATISKCKCKCKHKCGIAWVSSIILEGRMSWRPSGRASDCLLWNRRNYNMANFPGWWGIFSFHPGGLSPFRQHAGNRRVMQMASNNNSLNITHAISQ